MLRERGVPPPLATTAAPPGGTTVRRETREPSRDQRVAAVPHDALAHCSGMGERILEARRRYEEQAALARAVRETCRGSDDACTADMLAGDALVYDP